MESVPTLSTPEEELAYLRGQVARKEAELAGRGLERPQIIAEAVHAHKVAPVEILAKKYRVSEKTVSDTSSAILAELNLGGSAQAIQSLERTLEEKGIKNTLSVLEKMRDPRLSDDFHRYLVRYIAD